MGTAGRGRKTTASGRPAPPPRMGMCALVISIACAPKKGVAVGLSASRTRTCGRPSRGRSPPRSRAGSTTRAPATPHSATGALTHSKEVMSRGFVSSDREEGLNDPTTGREGAYKLQ
mmetsp:Transcript_11387/g.18531  ORF Transcript_11387/g.18531 Transcript_11387/m.18531 type:complete len:117 (+) Transcript_11387:976-1326(+)